MVNERSLPRSQSRPAGRWIWSTPFAFFVAIFLSFFLPSLQIKSPNPEMRALSVGQMNPRLNFLLLLPDQDSYPVISAIYRGSQKSRTMLLCRYADMAVSSQEPRGDQGGHCSPDVLDGTKVSAFSVTKSTSAQSWTSGREDVACAVRHGMTLC